jgi:hypothetical protein
LDGRELGRIQPETSWQTFSVPINQPAGLAVLTIRSDTFRPRAYDRASPDNRDLGVMVDWVALREREQGTGNREQGTGNREQGTGNREQGTGNREQGTGNRE